MSKLQIARIIRGIKEWFIVRKYVKQLDSYSGKKYSEITGIPLEVLYGSEIGTLEAVDKK